MKDTGNEGAPVGVSLAFRRADEGPRRGVRGRPRRPVWQRHARAAGAGRGVLRAGPGDGHAGRVGGGGRLGFGEDGVLPDVRGGPAQRPGRRRRGRRRCPDPGCDGDAAGRSGGRRGTRTRPPGNRPGSPSVAAAGAGSRTGAVAEPRLLLREFGRGDLPLTDTVEKMSRLVREYMDSLNGLVVVWIDELDRCPPEYALGMLGAVRSICDHAGVATVVSVRPDTLEAAVARIHGDHAGAGCWSRLPRPRTPSCRRTPESTSTRRSRRSPAAASAGSGAEVRSHRRRRSAQSDRSRAPRGGRPWGVSPAIGPGRETCRQTL